MLEQTWRWFGPEDRITLGEIKQTGATGIVTALHHIPIGEIWTVDEIMLRKKQIEDSGLVWSVAESVPVHEDIKKQEKGFQKYIENYKQTIHNLGLCGIRTVCYNFMPVLDWSRTNLASKYSDGSEVTRFDHVLFITFDIHILKRKNAEDSYPSEAVEQAREIFRLLNDEQITTLEKTILLGLPGSGESFTLEQLRQKIKEYEHIDAARLRKHLLYFIREIVPVAELSGVRMAIHPDDPPWSLMGLPRIVSTAQDLEDIINTVDTPTNGIAFCTGSIGAGYFNDVGSMAEKFAYRINYAHLRNVSRDEKNNFSEDYFFKGDVDMYRVMKALIMEEERRIDDGRTDFRIPVRPDHGNQMLGDIGKKNYPGYSLYGRMKNLAEIRGLEIGVRMSLIDESKSNR
jgi:mannonate dehydratase